MKIQAPDPPEAIESAAWTLCFRYFEIKAVKAGSFP